METDPIIISLLVSTASETILVLHFSYGIYFIQPSHIHLDKHVIFIHIP